MNDVFDDVKKIRFLDELLVLIGKDKIALKDLKDNPLEHFTMLFGKSGELDIHKTKEGTVKEYESLAKVNFEDLLKNILSSGISEEKFVEELLSAIIKVTFTEEKFSDYKIIDMTNIAALSNLMIKKKREAKLTHDSLKDVSVDDLLIPWNKGKQHVTEQAMVVKDGETVGIVFRKEEDYFYMPLDSFLNTSFGQIIQKLLPQNKD